MVKSWGLESSYSPLGPLEGFWEVGGEQLGSIKTGNILTCKIYISFEGSHVASD